MTRTSLFSPCEALEEAGISSPESYSGKKFCAYECPYDRCVMVEPVRKQEKMRERIGEVGQLVNLGYSSKEISVIMSVTERTVRRYLGGK